MTAFEQIKKGLEAAEQFIVNGVELGYIRMPNPETPDRAHDTLPMIRQAQTALESLQRENEELRNLADRLKQEAQIHAMEARSANSTVNEIYQIISGSKGELANYHGAEPVRKYVEAAEAEVKRLRSVLKPMAEVAGDVSESRPDDAQVVTEIGHFRRARTALASTGGENNAE